MPCRRKKPIKRGRKTLFDVTKELLIHRPRTLPIAVIAKEIGVSEAWLNSILSDRIQEPGVNAVQRLYEYLSGRQLEY